MKPLTPEQNENIAMKVSASLASVLLDVPDIVLEGIMSNIRRWLDAYTVEEYKIRHQIAKEVIEDIINMEKVENAMDEGGRYILSEIESRLKRGE